MQYKFNINQKERLEAEFLQGCQTLKKKSLLGSKEVKAKINWNSNRLTCLSSLNLQRGNILYDPINRMSIEISLIEKKRIKFPNEKLSSDDCIFLDVCRFKRVKEA